MNKKFNFKNLRRRNWFLTVVALLLVMLVSVSGTYAWIEQISNVEMTYGGQDTPMKTRDWRLNRAAVAEIDNTTQTTENVIDLSRYFYESGDMHLSSCYSDGKTFYFPIRDNDVSDSDNKKVYTLGESTGTKYRLGTKDDANVNYISVSFKITNDKDYEQAYWFDKNSTFFNAKFTDSNGDVVTSLSQAQQTEQAQLNDLIRCSITVDGATSIFSPTEKYHTVSGISASSTTEKDCQSFETYKYDSVNMDENDSNNSNLSSVRGANGNVLFTLPAKKSSLISIKVWLEYSNNNRTASLSDVNLKLVSSFAKTRKIFITDESVYSTSSSSWLCSSGATLWLAVLKEHTNNGSVDYYLVDKKWQLKKTSNDSTSYSESDKEFYVEIPAYYNNWKAVLLRCSNSGFAQGSSDATYNGTTIKYNNGGSDTTVKAWNWWATTLPDTYDNRTFTEYTPKFGSWYDSSKVGHVFFAGNWGSNTKAYLWDDSTVIAGTDTKVVQNQNFPGENMYNVTAELGQEDGMDVFVVFYDTDYSHVIFSNNGADKTADLTLVNGRHYSAADTTLQWKYYGTDDNNEPRFAYTTGDGTHQYAYVKLESGHTLNFKVHNFYSGANDYYGATGTDNNYTLGETWTLNGDKWVNYSVTETAYYLFEWNAASDKHQIKVTKTSAATPDSGGSSNGYYMWYNTNNSTDLSTAASAGAMTALGDGTYYSSFTCKVGTNYDIVINDRNTKGSILNSSTGVTGNQSWAKVQDNSGTYWALDSYWSTTTMYVIFDPTLNKVRFTTTNPGS